MVNLGCCGASGRDASNWVRCLMQVQPLPTFFVDSYNLGALGAYQ